MAADSYEYYLRLLKLTRTASEADIRDAISKELRVWAHRQNAPILEKRQEAERKVKALEEAEKVLLGAEGQIIRSCLGGETANEALIDTSIDAERVAKAIERVTSSRGMKAQERKGTVLYRRATIFYRGVDYLSEELVHKKYEATQDRKRCAASHGGQVLFNWYCETGLNPEKGKIDTYIQGSWVVDLVAFATECEGAATG